MFLRVFSDLHLEFNREFSIDHLDTDKDTVLCLAGDICSIESNKYHEKLLTRELRDRFKEVIMIAGNHEYYGGSILAAEKKLAEYCEAREIKFLQKETTIIDGVAFIGATLWTNLLKPDPYQVYKISRVMNDFRKIRTGPASNPYIHKFSTTAAHQIHEKHLKFIESELEKHKDKTCCVVTHHAPSLESIHQYYRQNYDTNNAYYSDLDDLILKYQPKYWLHGHSHLAMSYNIDNTLIINNAVGYPTQETGFDPVALFEI